MAATFLVIAAGAALFEAALIPGVVIGAAAVLAPKYLHKLRRRPKPVVNSTVCQRNEPSLPAQPEVNLALAAPARLGVKQAVLKTLTFRIIVTSVDFTTNYVVIGELTTAAGLSAVSLVAGPIFYFVHETAWNYFGSSVAHKIHRWGIAIDHPVLPPFRTKVEAAPLAGQEKFPISRAVAKTVTFRTFATLMDFTTNFVMTRDLATAAKLSAIGFAIGPFVYLGHEKVWDYYGSPRARPTKSDGACRSTQGQAAAPRPCGPTLT